MRLGEVIGALIADVTHARRMADEEAVRLAEYYQQDPLLSSLPVPRIRLPEVVVDLPIVIEEHISGTAEEVAGRDIMASAIYGALKAAWDVSSDLELPEDLLEKFRCALDSKLAEEFDQRNEADPAVSTRARASGAARSALRQAMADSEEIPPAVLARLEAVLDKSAKAVAVAKAAQSPSLAPHVETSQIKEESTPQNVARLRIVLREEGLQWHRLEESDGSVREVLTPE